MTYQKTVYYTIICKELNICRTFLDQHTAHLFAEQVKQDYPNALIERFKCISYFEEWELNGGVK